MKDFAIEPTLFDVQNEGPSSVDPDALPKSDVLPGSYEHLIDAATIWALWEESLGNGDRNTGLASLGGWFAQHSETFAGAEAVMMPRLSSLSEAFGGDAFAGLMASDPQFGQHWTLSTRGLGSNPNPADAWETQSFSEMLQAANTTDIGRSFVDMVDNAGPASAWFSADADIQIIATQDVSAPIEFTPYSFDFGNDNEESASSGMADVAVVYNEDGEIVPPVGGHNQCCPCCAAWDENFDYSTLNGNVVMVTGAADPDPEADPVVGIGRPGNLFIDGLAGTTKYNEVVGGVTQIDYAYSNDIGDYNYAVTNAATLSSRISANPAPNYTPFGLGAASSGDFDIDRLQAAIEQAFDMIGNVARINFNDRGDFFQNGDTDFKIMGFQSLPGLNGIATFPGTDPSSSGFESYVLYTADSSSMNQNNETGGGTNREKVAIHELLHNLGIGHPQDTGAGSATFTIGATSGAGDDEIDNDRYTVMSAERGGLNVNDQNNTFGYSVTPMALDISALHWLYGAATNHTGNTIYNLTDTGTTALDVNGDDGSVSIGRAFYGIWDTGGTDLIRYTGTTNVVINLNQATLNQTTNPADVQRVINDISGLSLFNTLLPNNANGAELRNEILDPDFSAGGFGSRLFNDNGSAVDGGFYIANDLYAGGLTNFIENINGGNGDDILIGNQLGNSIVGNAGTDAIAGGDGNDTLNGGSGDDQIRGGSGNDRIIGGIGDDLAEGGIGDDIFEFTPGSYLDDTVDGGTGTDKILLSGLGTFNFNGAGLSLSSIEEIEFNADASGTKTANFTIKEFDSTVEVPANLLIDSSGGNVDILNFTVVGAVFSTTDWSGWTFQDWDDTLDQMNITLGGAITNFTSTQERDNIQGGTNDETISSGLDNDTVDGGAGNDSIDGGDGNDELNGGAGADTLIGGDGDDIFIDDLLAGPGDIDSYNGGAGTDIMIADQNWSGSVLFNLQTGLQTVAGVARDTYTSIENLTFGGSADAIGSAAANLITANGTGNNDIDGGSGNDTIFGGGGNDTLEGGSGVDSVNGGDGDDTIVQFNGWSGGDTYNGGAGVDTFDYSGTVGYNAVVDLTTGTHTGSGAAITLISIENVIGNGNNDSITGSSGANLIEGNGGNDTIAGGGGADTLLGGGGNDTLDGGFGTDDNEGGAGNDLMFMRSGDGTDNYDGGTGIDTVDFTDTNINSFVNLATGLWGFSSGPGTFDMISVENLIMSGGNDTVIGSNGSDSVLGEGGNDTLDGGGGNDSLDGGVGEDRLLGRSGNDSMRGGADDDLLIGANGDDTMLGGLGNDRIIGAGGGNGTNVSNLDSLVGSDGNDTMFGSDGNDTLLGGNDDDQLRGNGGNDFINGGAGIDRATYYFATGAVDVNLATGSATGGDGVDVLISIEDVDGSNGFGDLLSGNGADNRMNGLNGNDTIFGANGNDVIIGDDGNDVLYGAGGENGSGAVNTDRIDGGTGRDFLYGSDGNDTLIGRDGDDFMVGNGGNDIINGGAGIDWASYRYASGAVVANLTAGASAGADGVDTLVQVERLQGSAFNDNLIGNGAANVLAGFDGNDTLDGRAGNDLIQGDRGDDTITGGAGADRFVFANNFGDDVITDFDTVNAERLDFRFNSNLNNFGDVLANLINTGGFAQINDGANSILLEGIAFGDVGVAGPVSAADFIF